MRCRYWIKAGLQRSCYTFFTSVLTSILMVLFEHSNFETAIAYCTQVGVICATIMVAMFNANDYVSTVPLLLRFGCTRREAFYGLQCLRLIASLPPFLLIILSVSFLPNAIQPSMQKVVAMYLCSFLCAGIGGNHGAFIYGHTYGKGFTRLAFTPFAAIVLGFIFVGCIRAIPDSSATWAWLVVAVNALICFLCAFSEYKALKKFSVQ